MCRKPGSAQAASIVLIDPPAVVSTGTSITLQAAVFDKDQNQLKGPFALAWTSRIPAFMRVDAQGTATAGQSPGVATISVGVAGSSLVSAPVSIQVLSPPTKGTMRVLVYDQKRAPIKGAHVLVTQSSTVQYSALTDANGSAVLKATPPFNVHVFHQTHDYFSAFDVTKTNLFIALESTPTPSQVGGVATTLNFDAVKSLYNISDKEWGESTVGMGIAGLSMLPSQLLDMMPSDLLGLGYKENIFGTSTILPANSLVALQPGGKPTSLGSGAAGQHMAWALGGKYQQGVVTTAIRRAGSPTNLSATALIALITPFYDRFAFGQKAGVMVALYPTVKDLKDANDNKQTSDLIPDFTKFTPITVVLEQKLSSLLEVTFQSRPVESVNGQAKVMPILGVLGVVYPMRGWIPLGMFAAPATEPTLSKFLLKYPPTLLPPGGRFVAALYATSSVPAPDRPPNRAVAIQTFASVPSSISSFEWVRNSGGTFVASTREITAFQGLNASFHRLQITDKGKRWNIWFTKNTKMTLPPVPTGFSDRIGAGSQAVLRAYRVSGNLGLERFLELGQIPMKQMYQHVSGLRDLRLSP